VSGVSIEQRIDLFTRNIQFENDGSGSGLFENRNGYIRFHQAAAANSNLVQQANISQLIGIITKPSWSGDDINAAQTLLAAARWQPDYVLSQKSKLYDLPASGGLSDTNASGAANLHSLVLAALARANYEAKKILAPLSLQDIQSLLRTRTDFEQRTYGVFAAYLFWLDRPSERPALERELRSLRNQPQPDLRIAANRALEMIWVGSLTLIDTINNPAALARARLDLLAEHPEPHIASAARISMERWFSATSASTTKG
jgi:hypothetical protein